MYCQGQVLSITPNLYDALEALRQPYEYRLLWIDQICINQGDNEEKDAQVQLIHLIYSNACQVVVWLSREIFHRKSIPDHLNQLVELYKMLTVESLEASRLANDPVIRSSIENIPTEVWETISMIFHCSYFTRICMIQEVVMARECWIIASGAGFQWQWLHIIHALLSLGYQFPLPADLRKYTRCFAKMATIRFRLQIDRNNSSWPQGPRWTLLDFVRKTWHFDATDKRDKIYALLGLLELKEFCVPPGCAD